MRLRRLNEEGVRRFAEYLDALKTEPALVPPTELLVDAATSEEAARVEVAAQKFSSRFEAGSWLFSVLEQTPLRDTARDKGLWAWLSLLHFDAVCPPDGRRHRKPGKVNRHIPEGGFKTYYRHLLSGPWRIYRAHRDNPNRALALLVQPVSTPGDIVEQIAAYQELVTNRSIVAAATELYVDKPSKQPKRGTQTKRGGGPRRFVDFCNQIDVTWDLYAMSTAEVLAKLPREFQRFQPAP